MTVLLDAQTRKQLRSIALSIPAIHLGERLFKFCRTISVSLCHFALGIEGIALLHIIPKWLVTHKYRIYDGIVIIFEVVLLKYGEAFSRSHFDCSLIRLKVTADGAEKG